MSFSSPSSPATRSKTRVGIDLEQKSKSNSLSKGTEINFNAFSYFNANMILVESSDNFSLSSKKTRNNHARDANNDEQEYSKKDFDHLIGTYHRDPDDNLIYKVLSFHEKNGYIVGKRFPLSSRSSKTEEDTIHALDIASYEILAEVDVLHLITPQKKSNELDNESKVSDSIKLKRSIVQVDAETFQIIRVYNDKSEIEQTFDPVKVLRCCKGEQVYTSGYRWCFQDKYQGSVIDIIKVSLKTFTFIYTIRNVRKSE
jgi:hypothetical protein